MIDEGIRIGFLAVAGLAVSLVALWLLNAVFQQITGTGRVVLDQFTVVRTDGKTDEEFGKGLAQGLQARLPLLERELDDAQSGLSAAPTASDPASVAAARQSIGLPKIIPPGGLTTSLLQPVDLKLSVAGVDVGGLIPWLQRKLTNYRTLYFTISVEDDRAEIYGSLTALGSSNSGLNLTILGENGKPPSLGKIVDLLAHDILRRYYLYKDPNHKLASLTDEEFEDLSNVLVGAELANRRTASGRHNPEDFSKLIPAISGLVNTAPNWPELVYLAAWIADSGEDTRNAIKYYEQVRPQFVQINSNDVVRRIDDRVKFLTNVLAAAGNKTAGISVSQTTPATALDKLPPSVDYSSLVEIKDMGQEGSSVGQALATALEVKLAKNNIEKQISARFIYYAARKIEGTSSTDSGAQIQDGFNVLLKEGAVEESVWPYVAGKFAEPPPPTVAKAERFRIAAYRKVRTLPEMKRDLVDGPPLVAGITIFQEMLEAEAARTGIVPMPAKGSQILGGHAVVIVGYDDKTQLLKFANSWGAGWGDKGFGYLPYGYITDDRVDAWVFTLP